MATQCTENKIDIRVGSRTKNRDSIEDRSLNLTFHRKNGDEYRQWITLRDALHIIKIIFGSKRMTRKKVVNAMIGYKMSNGKEFTKNSSPYNIHSIFKVLEFLGLVKKVETKTYETISTYEGAIEKISEILATDITLPE